MGKNKKSLLEIAYRLCGREPEEHIPEYDDDSATRLLFSMLKKDSSVNNDDLVGLMLNRLIQGVNANKLKAYRVNGICCNPKYEKQPKPMLSAYYINLNKIHPINPTYKERRIVDSDDSKNILVKQEDFSHYLSSGADEHILKLWGENPFSWEDQPEPEKAKGEAGEDKANGDAFIRSLTVSLINESEIKIKEPGKKYRVFDYKHAIDLSDKQWSLFKSVLEDNEHSFLLGPKYIKTKGGKKDNSERKMWYRLGKSLVGFLKKEYPINIPKRYVIFENIDKKKNDNSKKFKFEITEDFDSNIDVSDLKTFCEVESCIHNLLDNRQIKSKNVPLLKKLITRAKSFNHTQGEMDQLNEFIRLSTDRQAPDEKIEYEAEYSETEDSEIEY